MSEKGKTGRKENLGLRLPEFLRLPGADVDGSAEGER